MSTGKHLRRFESKDLVLPSGAKGFVLPGGAVVLSADGKTLASSTQACGICFWDTATGRELPVRFAGEIEHSGGVVSQFPRFVLSPDGTSVATTRSQTPTSGVIRWDLATGEKWRPDSPLPLINLADDSQHKKRLKLADRGEPAAFSPDGRLVAILDGKEVRLVDAATGLVLRRMTGDAARVTCASFSPDGKTLATSGEDKAVNLWESATGERREQLIGHQGRTNFVAFAPDGRRLASGGEDHTVLIWDLSSTPGKNA